LKENEGFSYASSYGRPEIRTAWKNVLYKKNPSLVNEQFSTPVVTSALTHGLSMAGYLFVNENDTIISPDYHWENYDLIFSHAYNGVIKTFPLFTSENGFNVRGLEEKLAEGEIGKKIIILNFPNNPTGYTVTNTEAQQIKNVLVESANRGNEILVFIDDAYFGLVFEKDILKESMFSLLANAHEKILAVKLDGPTKEDYVWGFRVGFITFGVANGSENLYHALESKLAGAIRGNISNASNIAQSLLLSAYFNKNYENEKKEKYQILQKRYQKIREIINSHPEYNQYFTPYPFNSGYFMCVKLIDINSERIRKLLLDKYSTGVITQGDIVRIAFSSLPYNTIEKLFQNLYCAARECITNDGQSQ
ncbi:MAG: aminotransferase class I/II-fold pyridoxal phosphate-dependent enzyme, partial [Fibrobacter sp.]|nr:aminotransferase class I/II-fold pyridoxal phosphate-dependent enzyme [Fibrobacter sp.]